MKKILSILISAIFLFPYAVDIAYAQVPDPPVTNKQLALVGANERPNEFPYRKKFVITAYYRPMPDQKHYAAGSFDAETRMNGDSYSADGTHVYPGMVAAPKSYQFGTKMYIPGVGIVAIRDRGGAIVESGQKNQEYDRLDIWMGSGDKGLERALAWGKRAKEVIVYGINPDIKEDVYLEDYALNENAIVQYANNKKKTYQYKMFLSDVWYLSKGEDVKKLQNTLYTLGYLEKKPYGFYDKVTREAVFKFQKDNDVVNSWEENGAGHTGPMTRYKLEVIYTAFGKEKIPRSGLRKGSKDESVKKLQQILKDLGYSIEITGVFDEQTANAVLMFQIDNGILPTVNSVGAKIFGPKTRSAFIRKYLAKLNSDDKNQYDITPDDFLSPRFLTRDLQIGDSGENVAALQKELYRMNYLKMKPTGYFGALTKHAVFKFQQALDLMDNEKNPRAGIFGPTTRGRLNQIIAERSYSKRLIAEAKKETLIAEKVELIAVIEEEMDLGESGEKVKELQGVLKKLGYYKSGLISGYFGEETKKALIAFQKDKGIIASEDETGAGRVGPTTKKVLNEVMGS